MNSIDLTGQRFGRLIAVKYVGKSKWECRCDCGNVKIVNKGHLLHGDITSWDAHKKKCPKKIGSRFYTLVRISIKSKQAKLPVAPSQASASVLGQSQR